jgi:hypothetical protein
MSMNGEEDSADNDELEQVANMSDQVILDADWKAMDSSEFSKVAHSFE